jgi:hypothetical protein
MLYNKNWLIYHDQPDLWEGFRSQMLASPHSPQDNPEEIMKRRNGMIDTFKVLSRSVERGHDKRYILTQTAQDTIKRIKTDKIDITMFADAFDKITVHKAIRAAHENLHLVTVVTDRRTFFRFIRISHEDHFDQIWCARVWTENTWKTSGQVEAYFDIFSLDIKKGLMDNYANYAEEAVGHELSLNNYLDNVTADEIVGMEKEAVQILTYLYLSQLEFEVVKGKSKKKINGQKYVNQTENDIVLVDSKWNIEIHREEGFEVKGHLRLQPCGVGRMETMLIWVDGYQKHGYHRKAGKQIHEGEL